MSQSLDRIINTTLKRAKHKASYDGTNKSLYSFLALFVIAVATYYFSIIYGGFISLDDAALVTYLINSPPFDLASIFLNPGGRYYRPLIDLSYRLDHLIWSDIAFGYHQTNVFHHTLNVFLVYIVAQLLFEFKKGSRQLIAFLSAVFFAVNPLLSESVCWVSGRSDIIASNFILSSFVFYLLFKKKRKNIYLALTILTFLLAMLTKEIAIMLPAIIIAFELFHYKSFGYNGNHKAALAALLICIAIGTAYLLMRGGVVGTGGMAIAVGEGGVTTKSNLDNIRILFASYGFYFKKLFFPYPLNFAIHRINEPLYALLGVFGLSFVLWGLFRPSIYGFFAAWIVLALSPAVAAGMLMVAWTPWAERFLYLPMAGFSMAVGYSFATLQVRFKKRASIPFAIILIILCISTEHRVYLWTNELRLWTDTAAKTDYGPVYNLYGKSLLSSGHKEKAIEVIEKAIKKGYTYNSYLALAGIYMSQKEYTEYERMMNLAIFEFPKKKNSLRLLAEGYLTIVRNEDNEREKYTLKAIETYKKYLMASSGDMKTNFLVAALYKSVNRPEEAKPFLERVVELSPGSRHAVTALKALKELKQDEH